MNTFQRRRRLISCSRIPSSHQSAQPDRRRHLSKGRRSLDTPSGLSSCRRRERRRAPVLQGRVDTKEGSDPSHGDRGSFETQPPLPYPPSSADWPIALSTCSLPSASTSSRAITSPVWALTASSAIA